MKTHSPKQALRLEPPAAFPGAPKKNNHADRVAFYFFMGTLALGLLYFLLLPFFI